jgi:hypothetical protein
MANDCRQVARRGFLGQFSRATIGLAFVFTGRPSKVLALVGGGCCGGACDAECDYCDEELEDCLDHCGSSACEDACEQTYVACLPFCDCCCCDVCEENCEFCL